ncbi:MAG: response regulator [Proteobacteria bacterium]|nr:response regulator [Pseudomonadota bacterium]
MTESNPPLNILLIEDNQDHVRILKWAFEQSRRRTVLRFLRDGEEAMEEFKAGAEGKASIPDLIFLDFNLPRVDGRKVLRMLKADPVLKLIPVIILSSSDRPEDVQMAYDLGANTYVSKSVVLGELSTILQDILDYWTRIAKLPNRR